MILGVDIGGTHTDAICIKTGTIINSAKVTTDKENLVGSIVGAINELDIDLPKIDRIVLSTTLSTNAIIEKKYGLTGMIASAGPGIDPKNYFLTDNFYLVDGAIDHRGREYVPINRDQITTVAGKLKDKGITGVGIVSKFSVRNPLHEESIYNLISNDFSYISLGHQMSGNLNFSRRINTTYFNTAVMPTQDVFMKSVSGALGKLGIMPQILFLKADGGTYIASAANRLPVETIMSGPAASIMGGAALNKDKGASLVLDIGGTTTDIGLLVDGVPVMEPLGVSIGGAKTLVRGLNVLSVGAGGDSRVYTKRDKLFVGPQRDGPPAAMGGKSPTPTDALAILGVLDFGDAKKAEHALSPLAHAMGKDLKDLAKDILTTLAKGIKQASTSFIDELNTKPVYTIHEMLHQELIRPDRAIIIGGPARNLKPYIADVFDIPCIVPEYCEVANALGAALARTTAQITIMADTQMRRLVCPEIGIEKEIPSHYSMDDIKTFGIKALKDNASYLGLTDALDVDVVEAQSFNMVRGFSTAGKNMRLKIQSTPGIIPEWR